MDSGALIPPNGHMVREVQAPYAADFSRQIAGFSSSSHDSVLREYFRTLVKRKWIVLSCLLIIFTGVGIASLRMTKIYDAVGRIAINKAEPAWINLKDPSSGGMDYSDPADLDTEVQILQSDLLALQVIQQLGLEKRPEFGGSGDLPPNSLSSTDDMLQPDASRTSELLSSFKSGLRVALRPNTRIIEIHYRSPNKELAASVVNTLMKTYVEQNFNTKFESTMQTSDWLTQRLADLRMNVEVSQEKLVKYQKEHEILGNDEKQNIITDKLAELNKEVTAAETDRMERESLYRMVQSGDADTVAAATMPDSDGNAAPINGSGLLEKLRTQRADLKIQVAELSTQFGPAYPKVAQLSNQLKEVDIQIQNELGKIQARVRGSYLASLQRETMLRAALEKQKQEANKLNENAIEYSVLKREVDANHQLYDGLLERLKEAGVTASLHSNNFRIVDQARVPTAPSEPDIPRNLLFALALGLTTGIGLAFTLDALDNTVRTPEQAEGISALPALGMIPLGSRNGLEPGIRQKLIVAASKEAVELVTQSRPQSQMAESYRALRTSLLLSSLGAPPKVILVTSSLPQEGKTTTSINTALVLAQKGTRVLLIDADLRRPGVHKTLGLGPRSGLSNVLTGSVDLQSAITRPSMAPGLYVLPAGTPPPNPAELLASSNMAEALEELRKQFDHIVIDTPPTLSVTDAVVLSTRADAVILVIRSGQTTKQALRRARDLLMHVNAKVTGVLMNAVDLSSPDYYYYYEYQGKYGQKYYDEANLPVAEREETPKASSGI